jgi:hypothetical protein
MMPMPSPAPAGSTPFVGPGLSTPRTPHASAMPPHGQTMPAGVGFAPSPSGHVRMAMPSPAMGPGTRPQTPMAMAIPQPGSMSDDHGGDADAVAVAGPGRGPGARGAQVKRVRGALGPAVSLAAHGAVPGGAVVDRAAPVRGAQVPRSSAGPRGEHSAVRARRPGDCDQRGAGGVHAAGLGHRRAEYGESFVHSSGFHGVFWCRFRWLIDRALDGRGAVPQVPPTRGSTHVAPPHVPLGPRLCRVGRPILGRQW